MEHRLVSWLAMVLIMKVTSRVEGDHFKIQGDRIVQATARVVPQVEKTLISYNPKPSTDPIISLIPLMVRGEHDWDDFYSSAVFDGLPLTWHGINLLEPVLGTPDYINASSESLLKMLFCPEPSAIYACALNVHSRLHMALPQDRDQAWIMWTTLGNIWRAPGKAYYAMQNYRKALSLAPDNVDILHNIGNVLRHIGDKRKAKQVLEYVVQQNNNILYRSSFCCILDELGETPLEELIRCFTSLGPQLGEQRRTALVALHTKQQQLYDTLVVVIAVVAALAGYLCLTRWRAPVAFKTRRPPAIKRVRRAIRS